MKILGEKSTNYPIKGSSGANLQLFGHQKFGYRTSTFMSVTDPLSSFPGIYIARKGFTESFTSFSGPLSCRTGYFMKQIVALK